MFGAPADVYDLAAGSYVSLRSSEALSGLELEVSGDCPGGVAVDPDDPTRATIQASATFLDLNHVGSGWCELTSRAERLDGDARSLDVYEVQKVKVTAVSPPMVTTAAVFGGASLQVTALYGRDVDINSERTYTLNGFGLETWTITEATTVRSDPRRRLQDLVVTVAARVTITASVPGALDEPLTLEVVPLGAIAGLRWRSVDGAVSFFSHMTSIELLPVTDQNVLILGDVEYEIEDASSGALLASGTGRSFETAAIRAHFANQMTGELRVRVAGHVELLRIVLVD